MKLARKVMSLITACIMSFSMINVVYAEDNPTAQTQINPSITIVPNQIDASTQELAIEYTWYRIMDASIETNPTVNENGETITPGKAAYYVTTEDRATQLTNTQLFNVTKVNGDNKWYVELKNKDTTTAQSIVDAFDASDFDKTKFVSGTFNKTVSENQAESGTLEPGYYYITSSLGTKAAVETLAAVTINEKNQYPSNTKTDNKEFAAVDETVTYNVTVAIPISVAEKPIIIYDTITDGLTLNTAVTVEGAVENPTYTNAVFNIGTHTEATPAEGNEGEDNYKPATKGTTSYTLEIPAAVVIANKGKSLTFTYTAKVNENAVVLEKEYNKAHIKYDNYTTVDVPTDVTTLAFDIVKVDGADKTTELAGAKFKLYDAETGGNEIKVVLKDAASDNNGNVNVYRVAKSAEAGVEIDAGKARIEGLSIKTYYLDEVKAPTGYNQLENRVSISVSNTTSTIDVDYRVENNKGATMPSTGGIGTTIFYVVGGGMVAGAVVFLLTKRRMAGKE